MLDSKVVESIKSLSIEEREEFHLFLLSPYFHKGFTVEELTEFYALILAALSDTESIYLSKESVHLTVFSEKDYNEGRIDRLMFELNRLVKDFVLTKHYHREENEVQRLLDWSFIQRKKGDGFALEKQFKKFKKEKTENSKASIEAFLNQYRIAKEEHEWQSTYNKLKGDLGLPEVVRHLDLFYYTERLELLNRFLLQQKGISIASPEGLQMALHSSDVPEYYVSSSPILLITEKIHQLFRAEQPEEFGFQELMGLLQQHEKDLSSEVLYQFYAYLRNYCTVLIDAGNKAFEITLHEIQLDNLERGYFYHDGKIPPYAALSITMMALRVNKLSWAREFVESHKDNIIDENETNDFYRMNVALCLFAEKKFEEALSIIPFGSTYSHFHLMARRMELKIYYELNSELLPSKIDAFKMFISRAGSKSLSPNSSELFANFGNFMYQLSQSIQGDEKRSRQLTDRIKSKKYVGERTWLLEKAEELGNPEKK